MVIRNYGRKVGPMHLYGGRLWGMRDLSIPLMALRLVGSRSTVFGLLDRARRGRCRIGGQLRRGIIGKVKVPYGRETSGAERALMGLSGLV